MQRKKTAAQGRSEPYADNAFVNSDTMQGRLIKYKNFYSDGNKDSQTMQKKLYNDTMRVVVALHQDSCFTPDMIH